MRQATDCKISDVESAPLGRGLVLDFLVNFDQEGTELPKSKSSARSGGKHERRVIARARRGFPLDGKPWRMWITDQAGGAGKTLLRLQFSATEGPEALNLQN